jgi:hypothetical protein
MVSPDGLFGDVNTNWASVYFIASFAENAYLTLLITLRIWIYTHGMNRKSSSLRASGYGRFYRTFCTVFIESAVLCSIVALGGIVTVNDPMNMIWQSLSLPIQVGNFFAMSLIRSID